MDDIFKAAPKSKIRRGGLGGRFFYAMKKPNTDDDPNEI
jgi:hypothetical protein